MAWLFGDSFDHYTLAQVTRKWNSIASTDGISISSAGGRNGTNGLIVAGGGGGLRKIFDNPVAQGSTVIVGLAFKPDLPSTAENATLLVQVMRSGSAPLTGSDADYWALLDLLDDSQGVDPFVFILDSRVTDDGGLLVLPSEAMLAQFRASWQGGNAHGLTVEFEEVSRGLPL
jgi:hypothetical protein